MTDLRWELRRRGDDTLLTAFDCVNHLAPMAWAPPLDLDLDTCEWRVYERGNRIATCSFGELPLARRWDAPPAFVLQLPLCGAETVFWPDDEQVQATCTLPAGHGPLEDGYEHWDQSFAGDTGKWPD